MSLQTRLGALITAVGADIKELKARTPTILNRVTSVVETEQPSNAVEWRNGGPGGALLAKLVGVNPIEDSVIVNRSELRIRVKSRDGVNSQERLILDSDGNSDLVQAQVAWANMTLVNGWANFGSEYQTAQYRKVGTEVQLRGMIRAGSAIGVGHNVWVYPAGYEPIAAHIFAVTHSSGGVRRLDARQKTASGGADTNAVRYQQSVGVGEWIDLSMIRWSTI